MDLTLETERLRLVPLSGDQLRRYLVDPAGLEQELGLPLSRELITPPVRRAIAMKLAKMAVAPPADHPFLTYWLIVIRDGPFGAGMAGFKGAPDETGQIEIGYGIDPAFRNKGNTTEAVKALIDWAFSQPGCRSIVAPGTLKDNIASNRVLEKVGMLIVAETTDTLSWAINRPDTIPGHRTGSGEPTC